MLDVLTRQDVRSYLDLFFYYYFTYTLTIQGLQKNILNSKKVGESKGSMSQLVNQLKVLC